MMIEHKARVQKSVKRTLGELAIATNSTLVGDPKIEILGVGTIANAKRGEITFLAENKYRHFLPLTQASAVILSDAMECKIPALVNGNPKAVFAQVVALLYPNHTISPSIHPTAVIGKNCIIHQSVYVGPHCVIGDNVKIAANVILQSNCVLGSGSEIEESCIFYPNVTVYHGVKMGKECIIHSGAVIGSDGFGFAKEKQRWIKVPQIGSVAIGNRVEIGANTTIDRGAIEDTQIGDDVILDNLIQIGHNVKIGDGCAIAACVGIAGSAVIGKNCLIGGGSCINGHIEITDQVHIVGCSNVAQSITQKGIYASGLTVNDFKVWKKNLVRFHQLDELAMRIKELEKKLKIQEEA